MIKALYKLIREYFKYTYANTLNNYKDIFFQMRSSVQKYESRCDYNKILSDISHLIPIKFYCLIKLICFKWIVVCPYDILSHFFNLLTYILVKFVQYQTCVLYFCEFEGNKEMSLICIVSLIISKFNIKS